ncbi:hypothetical protein [Aliarcobacter butzleri]|uniref:hypothetical protein n=1 Tax=Aliarcobacter butzleri TaxID=28197 RepID=UPI002B24BD63|nr:hypothetical protein [Aliarcobacter butzleri]
MQTKESIDMLFKNINNPDNFRSKELIRTPCKCGKNFYINIDDLGLEKLCPDCKKSKTLLLENKQQNMQ